MAPENIYTDGSPLPRDFFAVLLPDGEEPFLVMATSHVDLAHQLRSYIGTPTRVYIFQGQRWHVSKGPSRRYLLGPSGQRVPLFGEEPSHEIDEEGSLDNRSFTTQEKVHHD